MYKAIISHDILCVLERLIPIQARRQLQAAGCLSEGESVASLGIGPPMMLGGPSGLIGDRGSCSADSGVRGME